jgi:hypothetical protein
MNVTEETKQPLVSVIMPCFKVGTGSGEWRVAGVECSD